MSKIVDTLAGDGMEFHFWVCVVNNDNLYTYIVHHDAGLSDIVDRRAVRSVWWYTGSNGTQEHL